MSDAPLAAPYDPPTLPSPTHADEGTLLRKATVTRRVAAPPEACMKVLLDLDGWPAWRPGLEQVASVSDRPVMAGTAWTEARAIAGRGLRLGARAVQVESPLAFAYSLAGDSLEATVRWELRPDGDGTLVTQACAARGRGLPARLGGLAARFLEEQPAALDALEGLALRQAP